MRIAAIVLLIAAALPAAAQDQHPVTDRAEFVSLVEGRALTRLGISLNVTGDGQISGRALGRPVSGTWEWQGDYFCRVLKWGGKVIDAYNCQAVELEGAGLRFTSDKGAGDSARLAFR
ncbi:dihydrodipicolinate reductase [Pseudooceanicola sp. LIPI14-2-Ac024]|uniref:dihydrodipicolinate reductase n=1 Tax=Pseudooceanicola sp. LIPI14-2-Ac024 TaxID=3344875 RepID=UPI0035CEEF9B